MPTREPDDDATACVADDGRTGPRCAGCAGCPAARQLRELEGCELQLQLQLPPTTDPERKGWNR